MAGKNPAYIDVVLIHEMTHLVQRYGWRHAPSHWVEGLADYVPAKMGFSKGRLSNFGSLHYSSGYSSAAAFLLSLDGKYGAEVVQALNRSLRERDYTDAFFRSATGQDLEGLWADYRRTLAYRASAELVDQLYRELKLDGTESQRVKTARLERYIDRHYDPIKAAEVRLEIGHRDGRPPSDAIVQYATFRTRRSLESQLAKSLQNHIEERIRNNTLPWMNKDEISAARKAGRVPWAVQRGQKEIWLEAGDGPDWSADSYPVTIPVVGTNSGQALFYHYEFVLGSPRAKWRLKRAWIAEPDGRVVEERVFDR